MTIARPAALCAVPLLALAALACSGRSGGDAPPGGNTQPGGDASPVVVTIAPETLTLAPLGQHAFTASVAGTADESVTWAVAEGNAGGSVTASGAYTAPATEGRYHVVVTSVADSTKSAVASVIVANASADDLCAGLVQDKLAHRMTAVTKPAVRQSYVDPQFGTTIRRISDAAAGGWDVVKPMYSTIQAWNADESYLILYHTGGAAGGHQLYDGRTYAHLKELEIRPADLEQVYWDKTDPKILYYVDITTRRLHRFHVDADTHATSTVVRDFSLPPIGCTDDFNSGSDPMWTSWNSIIGLVCGPWTEAPKMFAYNIATDTIGPVLDLNVNGVAPQPAPSGTLFFLSVNGTSQVRSWNMQLLRTLPVNSEEHATLGLSNGVDTHFSVQFDVAPYGTLIATNMETGAKRTIIGEANGYPYPPSGTHISTVAYKKPGWGSVSVVGNTSGAGLLDQEILLFDANTDEVCRVAHHRSAGGDGPNGYWAEPHASISPSGTRILFASDWGGEARVETYVVELPGYTP